MASPVFNVARWSVFGGGIVYGFAHQLGINAEAHKAAAQAAYNQKAKWIEQAKAEWVKLHPKPVAETKEVSLEDPSFDPAEWINSKVSSLEK